MPDYAQTDSNLPLGRARRVRPAFTLALAFVISVSPACVAQSPRPNPAPIMRGPSPILYVDNFGRPVTQPPAGYGPFMGQSQGLATTEQMLRQTQAAHASTIGETTPSAPREILQVRHEREPQDQATPDAPDQSDLLKNSKDPEFILRNFRTMWVDARDAQYFGSDQLKAALARNKGFQALHIRMVDDPRVADVLLKVGYTFAWDYPFQLKHQNTTIVLLAGKGQGPFSGPLGAADVANQFVKTAKPYRVEKEAKKK